MSRPAAPELDLRPVPSPRAVAEEGAGEVFLLHLDTGSYYRLDGVGAFIWARLDGRRRLAEVAAEVAERYRIGERRAAADLLELVESLAAAGLVEGAGGG